jgi:hypothetical protein
MERKYKKKSNLINNTGYTPGYASEKNPMNIIPSSNITMENTPYPVYGQPLDEFGDPIAEPTYMEPGQNYDYGEDTSYVAEVPAYKDGGKKQAWISDKIGVLMGEGRPQKQAIAIAYSMWNQKHEDGGYQMPEYQNAGTVNFGQAPNAFSLYNRTPDFNKSLNLDTKIDPKDYGFGTESQLSNNSLTAGEDWKKNNPLPQGVFASNISDDPTKTTATTTNAVGANNGIHQFYNPYGDIGMGDALYFGGQEFAKGNNWKGAAGVGLGLLKGTKDFLAGMGNQKRQDTIMKSYNENQRKNMTGENRAVGMKMGGYYQDGGKAYLESGQEPENTEEMENWYTKNPPSFMLSNEEDKAETPKTQEPQKEVWKVWEEKTGKPWKEAKKLGYTDGSAKGNLKLLSELNDSRFKKSNLRSTTKAKEDNTVYQGGELDEVVVTRKSKKASPKYVDPYEGFYNDKEGDLRNKKGVMVGLDGVPLNFIERNFMANPIVLPPKDKRGVRMKPLGPYPSIEESNAYNKAQYENKIALEKARAQKAAAQEAQRIALWGDTPKPYGYFLEGGDYNMVPQLGKGYYQEGGEQMGGEMPMPQEEAAGQEAQVLQQVAQMLQQGANPQEVLQQLVQSGIPQDQATQIIQAAMQQSQASPEMKCGGKMYQEGGEIEEEGEDEMMEGENQQQEQIEDQVEQALKQGADPQEVLQQLVQMGMPEEEAIQMIQEILQEMQNGEEQEAPEQEQPMMKNGGNYLEAFKGKVIKNYTYNKNTGNYDVEFE